MVKLTSNTYEGLDENGKTVTKTGYTLRLSNKAGEPQLQAGESVELEVQGDPKSWTTHRGQFAPSTRAVFKTVHVEEVAGGTTIPAGTYVTSFIGHNLRANKMDTLLHQQTINLKAGDHIRITRIQRTTGAKAKFKGKPYFVYNLEVLSSPSAASGSPSGTAASQSTPETSPAPPAQVLITTVPSLKTTPAQNTLLKFLAQTPRTKDALVKALTLGGRENKDGPVIKFTPEQAEVIASNPGDYGLTVSG